MRKDAILLGLVAAVAATNLACLALLLRGPAEVLPARSRPAEAMPAPERGSAAPATAPVSTELATRLGEIDARLAALAQEIHALGDRSGASPPVAAAEPSGDPSAGIAPAAPVAEKTRVQRMLEATQVSKLYWEDLEQFSEIRNGMDASEYLDLLFEKTGAFLDFDDERQGKFREVMTRRIAEHKALQSEQRSAYNVRGNLGSVSDPKQRETLMVEYRQLSQKYATRQKQFAQDVRTELASVLDGQNFLHKTFLGRVDEWFGYSWWNEAD